MKSRVKIRVLFFGATAEIVGTREMEAFAATPSELLASLIAEHPRLAAHRLLFSVNQQYATGEEIICDGDELAVFTAVSGG